MFLCILFDFCTEIFELGDILVIITNGILSCGHSTKVSASLGMESGNRQPLDISAL